MAITAIAHVRRMRGGSQAQLMRADDGYSYVVKFTNNPQHRRVLANEWLAARLAQAVRLPVPLTAQINVPPELIESSPDLKFHLAGRSVACESGLQFGSRWLSDDPQAPVYDWIPAEAMAGVENLGDFAGMLAFDKWTCNCDGRQVVYCRDQRRGRLRAYMVDQGFCFNAGDWNFPDSPLRALYQRPFAYNTITGWGSFEPWLARLENLPESVIYSAGREIPVQWRGSDRLELEKLLQQLVLRRSHICELLWLAARMQPHHFASWTSIQLPLARIA